MAQRKSVFPIVRFHPRNHLIVGGYPFHALLLGSRLRLGSSDDGRTDFGSEHCVVLRGNGQADGWAGRCQGNMDCIKMFSVSITQRDNCVLSRNLTKIGSRPWTFAVMLFVLLARKGPPPRQLPAKYPLEEALS